MWIRISTAVIDYLGGKLPHAGKLFMNEVVNAIPNVFIYEIRF